MSKVVEVMARAIIGAPLQTARPAAMAQATLDALDAAGFVVVPKEPTDEMLEASVSPRTACLTAAHLAVLKAGFAAKYRAMLDASRVAP